MDAKGLVVPSGQGPVWNMAPDRSAALKLLGSKTAERVMIFEEGAPSGTGEPGGTNWIEIGIGRDSSIGSVAMNACVTPAFASSWAIPRPSERVSRKTERGFIRPRRHRTQAGGRAVRIAALQQHLRDAGGGAEVAIDLKGRVGVEQVFENAGTRCYARGLVAIRRRGKQILENLVAVVAIEEARP